MRSGGDNFTHFPMNQQLLNKFSPV